MAYETLRRVGRKEEGNGNRKVAYQRQERRPLRWQRLTLRRRKYLACNDVKATARQIVLGYRLRWTVELFHKDVKMHLGFEDVATTSFDAVQSHVHWVYCAYILLHMSPPGVPADVKSIGEKQRQIHTLLAKKEKCRVLQKLTQIGGVERYKDELRQALTGT